MARMFLKKKVYCPHKAQLGYLAYIYKIKNLGFTGPFQALSPLGSFSLAQTRSIPVRRFHVSTFFFYLLKKKNYLVILQVIQKFCYIDLINQHVTNQKEVIQILSYEVIETH